MKHARGIDWSVKGSYVGEASELAWLSFEKLSAFYTIGARCGRCQRQTWLERQWLIRKIGEGAYFDQHRHRLRCIECDNRKGNVFLIGRVW